MRSAWGRTELALVLVAGMAGAYLVWLILSSPLMVSRDAALYLEAAMVLVEGGVPYIDFVDLNPPLAQDLHLAPVQLAAALGINAINAFYLLLMSAVAVSAALTYWLLVRVPLGANPYAALCIALTPAVCLLFLNSYMQLGQRVQLFLLALLPYLALRLNRYEGRDVALLPSIGIAVLLAVTANLKPPHYGGIVIICELLFAGYYLSLKQVIKPETLTLALLTLLYPVSLYFLMPAESKLVFFDQLIPLILASYSAYDPGAEELWRRATLNLVPPLAAIAFACFVLARGGSRAQRNVAVLAMIIACAGAYTYLAQGKGWRYHATTAEFAAVLATLTLAGMLLEKFRPAADGAARLRCGLMLAVALAGIMSVNTQIVSANARAELNSPLAEVMRSNSAPGDRIAILGTSANPQYPLLLQLERRSGTRYPFSFMVPLLYEDSVPTDELLHGYYLEDPTRRQLQTDYINNLNADINRLRPELVMILYYDECFDCVDGLSMTNYVYGFRKRFTFLDDYENLEPAEGFILLKRREETAD